MLYDCTWNRLLYCTFESSKVKVYDAKMPKLFFVHDSAANGQFTSAKT